MLSSLLSYSCTTWYATNKKTPGKASDNNGSNTAIVMLHETKDKGMKLEFVSKMQREYTIIISS
jgi:hypothetical protein